MRKNEKLLLLQALKGEAAAWRKLALQISAEEEEGIDQELCRVLLNQAMELGDEESFFLYYRMFPEENIQFDDESYKEMTMEYLETDDPQLKEGLKRYLTFFREKRQMNN